MRRNLLSAARSWSTGRAVRRLQLARYWQSRGDLNEAAEHARRALRLIREQGPAASTKLLAEAAMTGARVERDRDDSTASRTMLEWAVGALDTATPGVERDHQLCQVLVDLGDCHRRAGRYPQAIAALSRAQQLLHDTGVAEPLHEAALLTVLGIVAKETGDFGAAARWYAAAGRVLHDAGAGPADLASLHHNLAGLAHIQRQYQLAESHARQAVELRRRAPRATEVDVAADLAVLAAAVAGQRRHDEARRLFVEAMTACGRARPRRRYEIAVHLHGLAAIDHDSGQLDQAEIRYREALQLKEQLLGPDHPEIAMVANNLGTLMADQHRTAEAIAYYRRALTIAEHCFTPDHPTTSVIRHNLERSA